MKSFANTEIKFEALVNDTMAKMLDEEFQYQMNLSDGCYVFWYDTHFQGYQVEPALDATAQAILQYFADCGCPFSMLRLGRSLAKRNIQHGPIISDPLALKYLVSGIEQLNNSLFDKNVRDGIILYIKSTEFLLVCNLIATYETELATLGIWSEIRRLIEDYIGLGETKYLN